MFIELKANLCTVKIQNMQIRINSCVEKKIYKIREITFALFDYFNELSSASDPVMNENSSKYSIIMTIMTCEKMFPAAIEQINC